MNHPPVLKNSTKNFHSFLKYWSILLIIVFALPLLAYAYMGSFMRYSGDDYCYAWILGQNGFWKAQVVSYFQVSTYNGNRYALTFFSGLADLPGPIASGLLPGLVIFLWVLGLAFVLWQITRLLNVPLSWLAVIFGAEFLSLMTLVQAPDLYQILYWRTGMLTYLAPLIANAFLLAMILWQWRVHRPNWLVTALVCILAILAGGFSETGFALQMTYLVMLSAGAVGFLRRKQLEGRWAFWVCCAALLGTLLAGLMLAISPTNQERVAGLPPRPDFISLVQSTLENIRIFSAITLKSLFLSTVIGFIFPCGLGIIFYARQPAQNKHGFATIFIKIGLGVILGFLLLCACFMPSAYIQSSYPGLRALIAARFVMVLIIALTGWLVGQAAVRLFRSVLTDPRTLLAVSLGVWALAGFYVYMNTPTILADRAKFQKWAMLWDGRDHEIQAASQKNVKNIEVMQLDHVIPNVGELNPDPGYWYNNCAAGYYGVDSIRANQPGWDE